MHDLILVLCALLIYAGVMGGCTRIANVVGPVTINITPIGNKNTADELTEAING